MGTKRYYAVKKGRKTGVFLSWNDAKKSVYKYPNALHAAFDDLEAAKDYVRGHKDSSKVSPVEITYLEGFEPRPKKEVEIVSSYKKEKKGRKYWKQKRKESKYKLKHYRDMNELCFHLRKLLNMASANNKLKKKKDYLKYYDIQEQLGHLKHPPTTYHWQLGRQAILELSAMLKDKSDD